MSAGTEEKARTSGDIPRGSQSPVLPTVNPVSEKPAPPKSTLHPAFYVTSWIGLSASVILYNKWILSTKKFSHPIVLTAWHMIVATCMTQLMARMTTMLDGRKNVKMTGRVYLRAIVPIGFMFSLSLICGNMAYLYLSVAFIQMLKATMPVAVLLATWSAGLKEPNMKILLNVSIIVVGVVLASVGEIHFVLAGFMFQLGGIVFEATRLVMMENLLSGADFKMDPLVSLYYFAPACAVMNGLAGLILEVPKMTFSEIRDVGYSHLIANAMVAFLLNVSVVFLIGKTSSLVMTLCGVLKDILLVAASMAIWGTQVSGLQFFGYSVALTGLVYYKLGADHFKDFFGQAARSWAEFGAQRPALRKILITVITLLVIVVLLGGLAPQYAGEKSLEKVKDVLNDGVFGSAKHN